MTDIVERLRLFVPHCEDPNDYLEDEVLFLKAADEIERLREALREILSWLPVQDNAENIQIIRRMREIARAALGEKE